MFQAISKDIILKQIEQAFDGIPFPGAGHRSLYQAEAWDDYSIRGKERDHKGRWQDLPDQHILDCQWALPHLDEVGLAYYLPAVMSFVLREKGKQSGWIFSAIGHCLNIESPRNNPGRYQMGRLHFLNAEQKRAVYAFVCYYFEEPAMTGRWLEAAYGKAC